MSAAQSPVHVGLRCCEAPVQTRNYEPAAVVTYPLRLICCSASQYAKQAIRRPGEQTQPVTTAGTERCSEAVAKLAARYDIVVNIQGDEPLLEPEIIDEVVAALQAAPDAVYRCFTAVYPGHDALQPVCNSCQW